MRLGDARFPWSTIERLQPVARTVSLVSVNSAGASSVGRVHRRETFGRMARSA